MAALVGLAGGTRHRAARKHHQSVYSQYNFFCRCKRCVCAYGRLACKIPDTLFEDRAARVPPADSGKGGHKNWTIFCLLVALVSSKKLPIRAYITLACSKKSGFVCFDLISFCIACEIIEPDLPNCNQYKFSCLRSNDARFPLEKFDGASFRSSLRSGCLAAHSQVDVVVSSRLRFVRRHGNYSSRQNLITECIADVGSCRPTL